MINDIVTVELDDRLRVVVLKVGDYSPAAGAFLLPKGFGIAEVREALLASGQVRAEGDSIRLVEFIGAELLAELISSMLSRFDSPGIPGDELLEVRSILQDFQSGFDSTVEIPLMAIAWLDVTVREDLADEVRGANEVWSKPKFTVETTYHRQRRMTELLKRYSKEPVSRPRIMTPSATSLSRVAEGQQRTVG